MRFTVTVDDELLEQAQQLTGVTEPAALLRAGLVALIERESARRLARLGGTEAQLKAVRRTPSPPRLSTSGRSALAVPGRAPPSPSGML